MMIISSSTTAWVVTVALGISPMSLLWPCFIAAFLISLVTVWLNDLAVSWGRSGARRVIVEAVEEIAYSMLETQRCYNAPGFSVNVKGVDGRRLLYPTLSRHGRGNASATTITAEEAELHSDHEAGVLKLILRNGSIDIEGSVRGDFPDDFECR